MNGVIVIIVLWFLSILLDSRVFVVQSPDSFLLDEFNLDNLISFSTTIVHLVLTATMCYISMFNVNRHQNFPNQHHKKLLKECIKWSLGQCKEDGRSDFDSHHFFIYAQFFFYIRSIFFTLWWEYLLSFGVKRMEHQQLGCFTMHTTRILVIALFIILNPFDSLVHPFFVIFWRRFDDFRVMRKWKEGFRGWGLTKNYQNFFSFFQCNTS